MIGRICFEGCFECARERKKGSIEGYSCKLSFSSMKRGIHGANGEGVVKRFAARAIMAVFGGVSEVGFLMHITQK